MGNTKLIKIHSNHFCPFIDHSHQLWINKIVINHDCVPQLKVTLLWDDEPIYTPWNRQGRDCDDGGEDGQNGAADFADFAGGRDITFTGDQYHLDEFSGLDAQGEFTIKIEDFIAGKTGELVDVDVEIDYYIPTRFD